MHPDQVVHRLLLNGLRDPVAVAVHPWKGLLFFAEAARPAKIYRCNIGKAYMQRTLQMFELKGNTRLEDFDFKET